MDFGAYFCKEVLSGIVCSKDEFSCSEFLAPTLTSSSRHKMVPKLRLESHLLTLECPFVVRGIIRNGHMSIFVQISIVRDSIRSYF